VVDTDYFIAEFGIDLIEGITDDSSSEVSNVEVLCYVWRGVIDADNLVCTFIGTAEVVL